MVKKISLRIRKIYFEQIVDGTKNFELRKHNGFWRKRLLEGGKPEIAVLVCGKQVHRRKITHISEESPEKILGGPLSEQIKSDIGDTGICYIIWLGEEIMKGMKI